MKRKLLLSPLAIVILIIIFGATIAGAAVLIGGAGGSEEVNQQKGLIGWWKFDGNAKDSTPNANHGTVTDAVLTTDREEQTNKAYYFDGTDDHVAVSDSSTLEPTGAVTIEFWVKPD